MLMELNNNDFNVIYGNEKSNTTCQNVCNGCVECIIDEYTTSEVTAGYDDKGNNIIVACNLKNYCGAINN
jgi:hypothetical protein